MYDLPYFLSQLILQPVFLHFPFFLVLTVFTKTNCFSSSKFPLAYSYHLLLSLACIHSSFQPLTLRVHPNEPSSYCVSMTLLSIPPFHTWIHTRLSTRSSCMANYPTYYTPIRMAISHQGKIVLPQFPHTVHKSPCDSQFLATYPNFLHLKHLTSFTSVHSFMQCPAFLHAKQAPNAHLHLPIQCLFPHL